MSQVGSGFVTNESKSADKMFEDLIGKVSREALVFEKKENLRSFLRGVEQQLNSLQEVYHRAKEIDAKNVEERDV